jgi:hypothetical protein
VGVWQVPDKHDPFIYHVTLHDVVTGVRIAELDLKSWPISPIVCGSLLIASFPNRVFAADLKTGREIWSHDVADLRYNGPYPPAAARPGPSPTPLPNP